MVTRRCAGVGQGGQRRRALEEGAEPHSERAQSFLQREGRLRHVQGRRGQHCCEHGKGAGPSAPPLARHCIPVGRLAVAILVNFHVPTGWRPVTEYEDAAGLLRHDIIDMGGMHNGTIAAVMGDMRFPWPSAESVPPQRQPSSSCSHAAAWPMMISELGLQLPDIWPARPADHWTSGTTETPRYHDHRPHVGARSAWAPCW